jgi:hypothetical protein
MTIFVDLYHVLADPSLWLFGVLIWCSCAIVVAGIWWIVLRHETRKAQAELAAIQRLHLLSAAHRIPRPMSEAASQGFQQRIERG